MDRIRAVVAEEMEEAMKAAFRSQQDNAEALRFRLLGILGWTPGEGE